MRDRASKTPENKVTLQRVDNSHKKSDRFSPIAQSRNLKNSKLETRYLVIRPRKHTITMG